MILQRYMFSKNTFITSKKLFSNGVFVFKKKKKTFYLLFLRKPNFCKEKKKKGKKEMFSKINVLYHVGVFF